MTKFEIIEELMKNNNGYLIVSNAIESGISKEYVSQFVKKNNLKRAAAGIYVDSHTQIDSLYVLSLRNNIIFSHETALYLHGLTEQEPSRIHLTVVKDYNAEHLRKNGCRVYTDLKNAFNVGKTTVKTNYGNMVPAYDLDRTVCEVIGIKDKMDNLVFRNAMKEYMKRQDKSLSKLEEYAKLLKLEDKVEPYIDVFSLTE